MAQYLGTVQLGGFYNNGTILKRPVKPWRPDTGVGSAGSGDIPQMSGSMANYTLGNTPAPPRTSSNGTRSRTAVRPSSFATGSSSSPSHGTTSTNRDTSQGRPSPSTGQGINAASLQAAAATATPRTPMREERPPITSGTGSSPGRRSSPGSRPRSRLTWTPAKTTRM